MNVKIMQSIEDFKEVVSILRKHNIQLWADLGTLLGFVREKDFLKWEEDVDVGCFQSLDDFFRAKDDLKDKGWLCFPKLGGLAIQNKEGKTKIDIKFYEENGDKVKAMFRIPKNHKLMSICDFIGWVFNLYPPEYKYETVLSIEQLKNIEKILSVLPLKLRMIIVKLSEVVYYNLALERYYVYTDKNLVLPLGKIKVKGYEFFSPNRKIKYLEKQYGKNWKTPMKVVGDSYGEYFDGKKWVKTDGKTSKYIVERTKNTKTNIVEKVK